MQALDGKSIVQYALVNSGSTGIGLGIAEALAKKNYNLILTARGADDLAKAKNKLEDKYGITVHTISVDLIKEESAKEVADYCNNNNLAVCFLANITGMGGSKDFLSLPLDDLRYMATLNFNTVMANTLLMIPILEKNAPSYIMNVSSLAGFAPIPKKNIYSASKSAVIFFSHSLRHQLKQRNIHVSCLCPGPVYTNQDIQETTRENFGWLADSLAVSPEEIGTTAVTETLNKKSIIVPGTIASIFAFVLRILPSTWAVRLYAMLS